MIKLTNTVLIGLISASLLVGCGGGSDNDDDSKGSVDTPTTTSPDTDPNSPTDTDTPTTPPVTPPTTTTSTFGANVMPVLIAKCQSCHGSNGNFTITDASMTYANIMALPGGATYMLSKGNGDVGHGGGDSLMDNEYTTIKSWIDAGAMNN